jgi:hypothetical protein
MNIAPRDHFGSTIPIVLQLSTFVPMSFLSNSTCFNVLPLFSDGHGNAG